MLKLIRPWFTGAFWIASLLIVGAQTDTAPATQTTTADTTSTQRKAAVIVVNHAGAAFDDKIPVLEDLVGTRVAGKGYSIISRDIVTQALSGKPNVLDSALNDNSSALRLAQNLGVDFILVPSIATYGAEKKSYSGNGVVTLNVTHTLRVSYKIVEAGAGAAIRGGTLAATKTLRQTPDLNTEDIDIVNQLLDDVAGQLADALVQNAPTLPTETAAAKRVHFHVVCTMTDPRQAPILVSAIGVTADNHVVMTNQPIAVQPMDVTVELDGIAIGSAPGDFQALPGLHKMRLSREGFGVWERTVNIYDGQALRVALQMNPESYARWTDTTAFLAGLDANRKLTDAEAKRIEGIAEFFKNSHYRIDSSQAPNVNIYQSHF